MRENLCLEGQPFAVARLLGDVVRQTGVARHVARRVHQGGVVPVAQNAAAVAGDVLVGAAVAAIAIGYVEDLVAQRAADFVGHKQINRHPPQGVVAAVAEDAFGGGVPERDAAPGVEFDIGEGRALGVQGQPFPLQPQHLLHGLAHAYVAADHEDAGGLAIGRAQHVPVHFDGKGVAVPVHAGVLFRVGRPAACDAGEIPGRPWAVGGSDQSNRSHTGEVVRATAEHPCRSRRSEPDGAVRGGHRDGIRAGFEDGAMQFLRFPQLFFNALPFRDFGVGSRNQQRFAAGVPGRDFAGAEDPSPSAGLVAQPVLELEVRGLAGKMTLNLIECPRLVRRVQPALPRLIVRPQLLAAAAQHGGPARAEVHLPGLDVPIPEAVVASLDDTGQPLGALLQRHAGAGSFDGHGGQISHRSHDAGVIVVACARASAEHRQRPEYQAFAGPYWEHGAGAQAVAGAQRRQLGRRRDRAQVIDDYRRALPRRHRGRTAAGTGAGPIDGPDELFGHARGGTDREPLASFVEQHYDGPGFRKQRLQPAGNRVEDLFERGPLHHLLQDFALGSQDCFGPLPPCDVPKDPQAATEGASAFLELRSDGQQHHRRAAVLATDLQLVGRRLAAAALCGLPAHHGGSFGREESRKLPSREATRRHPEDGVGRRVSEQHALLRVHQRHALAQVLHQRAIAALAEAQFLFGAPPGGDVPGYRHDLGRIGLGQRERGYFDVDHRPVQPHHSLPG